MGLYYEKMTIWQFPNSSTQRRSLEILRRHHISLEATQNKQVHVNLKVCSTKVLII